MSASGEGGAGAEARGPGRRRGMAGEVAAGAGLVPKLGVRGSWRRGGGWSWGVSPRLPSASSTVAAAGVIEMFRISMGGASYEGVCNCQNVSSCILKVCASILCKHTYKTKNGFLGGRRQ